MPFCHRVRFVVSALPSLLLASTGTRTIDPAYSARVGHNHARCPRLLCVEVTEL